jgi:formate dehydrogenase major subunit
MIVGYDLASGLGVPNWAVRSATLPRQADQWGDCGIQADQWDWQWEVDGARTRRTLGFASLGGATLDNEENYLIKKLFTALGAIQIENQARI